MIAGNDGYNDSSIVSSDNFTAYNYDSQGNRKKEHEIEPWSYMRMGKNGKKQYIKLHLSNQALMIKHFEILYYS